MKLLLPLLALKPSPSLRGPPKSASKPCPKAACNLRCVRSTPPRARPISIYLKRRPQSLRCVRYIEARGKAPADWSAPVSVNNEPKSAIAMGTIRGAQLAIGKAGTIHVAWNGAMKPWAHR